ncbi:MAG: penicillin-binding protein 2, partial [Actinomycetota bacterium]
MDRIHMRVAVIGIVFLALVAALVLRLWFLQVLSAGTASAQAVANIARPVPDPALRGSILDRNGQPLANNVASEVITVDRSKFETPAPTPSNKNAMAVTPDGEIILGRLASVLGMPISQLVANLNNVNADPFAPVPIATNVSQDAVVYIKEHQVADHDLFPNVYAQEEPIRSYPNGTLAANILGYVGEINSSDLSKASYKDDAANSIVGESGLEYEYEHYLHGKDGTTQQEVDSQGNLVGTLSALSKSPTPGDNLVTTINLQIQQSTEAALAMGLQAAQNEIDPTNGKKYPAVAGSAIVLNPNNGQVLAMASYPNFNPNDFVGGISTAEYQSLTSNPNDPLINRAIQAASAPGSTFKIVTAAAALSNGVATPSGTYPCPSLVRDYNQTFDNFEPTTDPSISVAQALVQSCDTVFYQFGQTFYQRFDNSTQGEVLDNYAQEFGFTKVSGIDLPGEQSGVVGTPAYVKKYPADFPYGWEPGYDIQEAIGQGPMAVTPIQVADAYAAIANGGTLYQPQLALRVTDPSTGNIVKNFPPVVAGHLQVSAANLAVIQQGLAGVVSDPSGTANPAFAGFPLAQFPIAGKTGTADVGVNGTLEP